MSPSRNVCSILALAFLLSTTHAEPVSKILNAYPDFSKLNNLLVSTGIDKLVDKQAAATILALNNDEIDKLSGLKTAEEISDIIKAHVALDYYDDVKLRHLKFNQPQEIVNLLQAGGATQSQQGLLKITRTQEGIFFRSSGWKARPDDAKFADRIYARQFNISIIKIDHPIYIDGLTGDLAPALPPTPPKVSKAPVAGSPEVLVAESPEDKVSSPASSPQGENSAAVNADDATEASSAGKVTFGLATLIMAASCIAAAL